MSNNPLVWVKCAQCGREQASGESYLTIGGNISGLNNSERYAWRCPRCNAWFCGLCSLPKLQELKRNTGLDADALMAKEDAEYWERYRRDPQTHGIFYEPLTCPRCKNAMEAPGSACFIATAAFGSDEVPQIQLLRSFRDEALLPSRLGRVLVEIYEVVSPSIADWMRDRAWARATVRLVLIKPLVWTLQFRKRDRRQ